MKKLCTFGTLLAALGLVFCTSLKAQEPSTVGSSDYRNALGVRLGLTSGITYKHIFGSGNAFEGILSSWPYSIGITGLYERNLGTSVAGLNCYIGAGAHIKMGSSRYYYDYPYGRGRRHYDYAYVERGGAVGIDGILGIEYKFRPLPLALSLDLKPFAEVNNYGSMFVAIDPSLGVKITF